ncbi:MAG: SDR family oxidoreductase, partial [Pseudomonadales bacterium]|nr:SDR family oxidoreductase [Pseudomonadales bacterium]
VQEGARVIMTDINEEAGQAAAAEIGENARFVKQDVSSEQGWQDLIAMVEQEYGQLNILVNNAAILQYDTLESESLEGFRRVMSINSESVFLGMKAAMPLLEKSGGGAIVNMSSVAAERAMPHFYAYGASKAAVQIMTKMTAVECHEKKNNVRCNCILPDGIATPMVMEMAGKFKMTQEQGAKAASYACSAEDVANTVLFLASDESKTISGISLPMDRSSSVTPPYI